MLDEPKLYQAFNIYSQLVAKQLPEEQDLRDISFSPRFEERMERLLHRQKRFYYPLFNTAVKRVACILSAVIISGSAIAMSVYGGQEEKSCFNVLNFSENGVYLHFFNGDLPYESTTDPITPKAPTYLPEGFFLKEDRSELRKVELIYEGEGADCLYYAQYGNSADASAYAEDATCDRYRVGDYEAYLLKSDTCTHLIFNDGEYLYQLNGSLTEEELLKVAQSIQ